MPYSTSLQPQPMSRVLHCRDDNRYFMRTSYFSGMRSHPCDCVTCVAQISCDSRLAPWKHSPSLRMPHRPIPCPCFSTDSVQSTFEPFLPRRNLVLPVRRSLHHPHARQRRPPRDVPLRPWPRCLSTFSTRAAPGCCQPLISGIDARYTLDDMIRQMFVSTWSLGSSGSRGIVGG